MAKKFNYKKKSKKGLSTVVITVILIAVSMASIVLVWAVVSNMIKKQIGSSESCYGSYDKIKINGKYTCYEKISDTDYKLRFSLAVGDIQIEEIIVSVSSAGKINSYHITNTPQVITNLVMYSEPNPLNVILPEKNTGLTYNATGFTAKIDSLQIAPVINGNLCEVSDSVSDIEDC